MSKQLRFSEKNIEILKKYHYNPDAALTLVLIEIEREKKLNQDLYEMIGNLMLAVKSIDNKVEILCKSISE